MTPYQITSKAKGDIVEIRRQTLESWGEVQSEAYIAKIRDAILFLSKRAEANRSVARDQAEMQQFACGMHMIHYRMSEEGLLIVTVLHRGWRGDESESNFS